MWKFIHHFRNLERLHFDILEIGPNIFYAFCTAFNVSSFPLTLYLAYGILLFKRRQMDKLKERRFADVQHFENDYLCGSGVKTNMNSH